MKGWIYIATMTNTVGVLKIGFTDRDPDIRVAEWSKDTGAPGLAKVEYAALVEHPRRVEASVHSALASYRQANSEWFNCSVVQAVSALQVVTKPLFEDDRASAAIEAKKHRERQILKDKEICTKIESERRIAKQVQRSEQVREKDRLRFEREHTFMVELANWEATPPSNFVRNLGLSLFLLLLLPTLALNWPESQVIVRPITLIVSVITIRVVVTRWINGPPMAQPRLSTYLADFGLSENDIEVREKLLANSSTFEKLRTRKY